MAPIPVHIKSPINAAKAEGITPKTAAADENGSSGIAQPGANPNNPPAAPTNPIQNQLHAPLQPTPTQKITPGSTGNNTNAPPPPQPGAVPVPYPPARQTAMPPPPGAPGNTNYASPPPPATTQPAVLPGTWSTGNGVTYPTVTPPQMGMSLTESAAPHTYRGTSTAPATTAAPGSRQVGYTTADNNGGYPGYPPPGGYQQNPNASGYEQSRGNDSTSVGDYQDDGDEGGVWNSAMKWAQTAGEKLSAAESEVWKRINKE